MSDDGGFTPTPDEPVSSVFRIQILNHLAKRFNYTTYLEIGVAQGATIAHLDYPLRRLVGVDPDPEAKPVTFRMTSNEFFEQNIEPFDLIFVDGLHQHRQAYTDVLNALDCMNVGGTVVMHDCSPPTEGHQAVPREQFYWNGDVWRAYLQLREIKELYMEVIDTDYGVGIIQQGEQKPLPAGTANLLTYGAFDENRKSLLNLKPHTHILNKKVAW